MRTTGIRTSRDRTSGGPPVFILQLAQLVQIESLPSIGLVQ